jgi:hypothetical protein
LSNSGTTQADRGAPSPAEGLFGYHRDYQDDTIKEVESIVGEATDALSSSDSVVSNSNTEDPICITSRSTTHSSVCDGVKSELIGCPEESGAVTSSYESDGFPFEGDADNDEQHSSVSISTCGSHTSESSDDHGKDDSPNCTRVDEENDDGRSSLRCTDQDIDKTEAKSTDGDLHASSTECGTTASTTCPPGTADASGVEVLPCHLDSEEKNKVKVSLNSSVVNGKLLIACDQLSRLVSPFALTITALSLMHALNLQPPHPYWKNRVLVMHNALNRAGHTVSASVSAACNTIHSPQPGCMIVECGLCRDTDTTARRSTYIDASIDNGYAFAEHLFHIHPTALRCPVRIP